MSDYKSYLAASILTEQKVASQSCLKGSRPEYLLNVRFLFEFHRQQNAKKYQTVHATYLISGTKPEEISPDLNYEKYLSNDGYDCTQSSPFTCSPSPSPDERKKKPPVKTIILVREEDLEEIRSKYEYIDSIHIYSLGPNRIKDLQILSDTNRELKEISLGEDPQKSFIIYGTIENKDVKKCIGHRSRPISNPSSNSTTSSSSKFIKDQKASTVTSKTEIKATPSSITQISSDSNTNKTTTVVNSNPTINRAKKELTGGNSQDSRNDPARIFRAFARTQIKPKKEKPNIPEVEKHVEDSSEDCVMKDAPLLSSDDEDDEIWAPGQASTKKETNKRESRKERENALKEMMEISEDEDKRGEVHPAFGQSQNKMDLTSSKEALVEAQVTTGLGGGRKRGKRRVLKKTTFKDEEGYLVTKEEQAWESFSEDELILKPTARVQSSTTSKSKKGTSIKPTQGNIMSFFGKK